MGEADEVLSPPNEDAKGYVSAEFKEALTLVLTLRMRASLHFVPGSLKYPTIVLAGMTLSFIFTEYQPLLKTE